MATKFTYKMRSGGKWDVGSGTRPTQTKLKKKKKKKKNWDGLDAKAFAGIYKSNWVCSVDKFYFYSVHGAGIL